MRFPTHIILSTVLCSLVGCGGDESGNSGLGEKGLLRFSYDDFGCFGGCSTEQPMASGARAVVTVHGDDPEARYDARSTTDRVIVEAQGLDCTCTETDERGSSSSTVQPAEQCFAPARKHCDRRVSVRAVGEGSTMLEMLNASGEVVDRMALSVVRAVRLEPVVRAVRLNGGTVRTLPRQDDGSFRIDAPVRLMFGAEAFDSQGRTLRAVERDFRVDAPNLRLEDFGDEMTCEFKGVADATLTITGLGLEKSFDVHVVSP